MGRIQEAAKSTTEPYRLDDYMSATLAEFHICSKSIQLLRVAYSIEKIRRESMRETEKTLVGDKNEFIFIVLRTVKLIFSANNSKITVIS